MNDKEKGFEATIERDLLNLSGYIKGNDSEFDKQKGYIPQDLIQFIKNTQGKEWKKLEEYYGDSTETRFLARVEKVINEHGLLYALRKGIDDLSCHFKLIYYVPEAGLNPELTNGFNNNICKEIRQLHYSPINDNSVDIALFINGFPIVILELKNQFTGQNVYNAVKQFKEDRNPEEPIFKFNRRALVYFAVDLNEVQMTTHLAGENTYFMPFNQGSNGAGNSGGEGNPVNTEGFATEYLWKEVLEKKSLIQIITQYMLLEKDDNDNEKMIFPRYHQLDVVTKLVQDVKKNNTGKNYLIEHSAGSGKSNSIAWLAYRLAKLHDSTDETIFDSVIVVTDRKVLDKQLQDTIYQFDHTQGLVEKIDKNKTSKDLLEAINNGKKIIITTIQKFPFIYQDIASTGKKFAIIVDEAHSSQTGKAALKLKAGLGDEKEILEEYARQENEIEKNTITDGDKILNEIAMHGKQNNLSFFGFTATPKPKTLQIFGTKQPDGTYKPFHIYSMRQAIEEGFILDVLKNYMTYKMYYKIVKTAVDDPEIQSSKGMKKIVNYVTLHPYNIEQKTAIMVEYFREHTMKEIGGRAKAMLVTQSRLHAVRYVQAFRKYIKENHYENEINALVAFSGEVTDPLEPDTTYTEPGLNIDKNGEHIKESALPKVFKTKDYNVLIVAEKYQTGYDEPLLQTMFVDKKLSGVQAVQTLSRLNRTCKGKTETFVLDFVNEAKDIEEAFQPFYQGTILSKGVDPNSVYDIYARLDAYKIIDDKDVNDFAQKYNTSDTMEGLNGYLQKSIMKYNELSDDDKFNFKHTLQAFVRNYQFVAQVIRLMNKNIHEEYLFCKYLDKVLPKDNKVSVDPSIVDKIDLQYYRLDKKFDGTITLEKEDQVVDPAKGTIGKMVEEEKTPLSELCDKINKKYGTNFTNMDRVFEQITQDFVDDEEMVSMAKNNPQEKFKAIYNQKFEKIAVKRYEQNEKLFDKLFSEQDMMEMVMKNMFSYVYDKLRNKNNINYNEHVNENISKEMVADGKENYIIESFEKNKGKFKTNSGRDIYYYGEEFGNMTVKNKMFRGINTLNDLFGILLKSWSKDTAYPSSAKDSSFNIDNDPTFGQCAVTAMLVYDMFGGTIHRIKIDGSTHYFNRIDNHYIDLTRDQFDLYNIPLRYEPNETLDRKNVGTTKNTHERFEILKKNIENNFK